MQMGTCTYHLNEIRYFTFPKTSYSVSYFINGESQYQAHKFIMRIKKKNSMKPYSSYLSQNKILILLPYSLFFLNPVNKKLNRWSNGNLRQVFSFFIYALKCSARKQRKLVILKRKFSSEKAENKDISENKNSVGSTKKREW